MAGMRVVWSLSLGAVAMAVAGCGGSHATSSANATTTTATSPKTQTTPATGALPVNDRVLQPSDFPRYIVTQTPPIAGVVRPPGPVPPRA